MNITQYIQSKPELDVLNFHAVYQTIISLIADGILSMDDLNKVKPVNGQTDFINN
jgi:hypothetical protein